MENIRQKAEAIWLNEFKESPVREEKDWAAILQELQIHQIELELQNQELRATQQELVNAQRQYFDLYNLAPVGYFSFDEQGLIIDVNLAGAHLLNRERRFLLNSVFFTHLDSETRPIFFNHLDTVFKTNIRQSCQLTLHGKGQSPKYVQIDSVPKVEHNRTLCHSTFADISRLKQSELALKTALTEKEVLLKELHHRVKNNLQIVSSLLDLQSSTVDDPDVAQIFKDGERRIKAMSLIHEQLYRSDNLAYIGFAPYITRLVANLLASYRHGDKKIALHQDIEDLHFGVDVAIPSGLIINELVSNALKHAFPNGQRGAIHITLRQLPTGKIQLSVRDNGVGLPPAMINPISRDINPTATAGHSLGLQLVVALTQQLEARLEVIIDQGTDVRITLNSTK